MQSTVNYFAVLAAAIVAMIIGFFWYSPVLFGTIWTKLSCVQKSDREQATQKSMWKLYLAAFIATLISSYVTAYFVDRLDASSFIDAVQLGFWLWLGFIVPVLIGGVLWEKKPKKLYFINIGHYLVTLIVMAVILTIWR